MSVEGTATRIAETLGAAQNPDGGLPAGTRGESHLEATAWTALALADSSPEAANRALDFLRRTQLPDGSWRLLERYGFASWATSLAALALADSPADGDVDRARRGAAWLAPKRGRTLGWRESWKHRLMPSSMENELDPDLRGWTWFPGTFSWVEPTAYALLLLRRLPSDTETVEFCDEAESLLLDRACPTGGWNYGNRKVLGVELPAYPDTTGLALVALQRHGRAAAVSNAFDAGERLLSLAPSGLALSWAALAAAVHDRDPSPLRQRLVESFERAGFRGQTRSLALAALALDARGAERLRLPRTA